MKQRIKLVIFDLDGTLLNTLSDLSFSANFILKKNGFPVHPTEIYKSFIGNGLNKFIERILPEHQKNEQNIIRIRDSFLTYYDEHIADYTKPYAGIHKLLKTLISKGFQLAVASNKHQKATEKLIRHLLPDIPFTAVLGQREGIPAKPDPTIVHEALLIAGILPEEAIFIGDSDVDIQTAANSNVVSIGVAWGFRPREELEAAGANYIVCTTNDIVEIVTGAFG